MMPGKKINSLGSWRQLVFHSNDYISKYNSIEYMLLIICLLIPTQMHEHANTGVGLLCCENGKINSIFHIYS